MVISDENVSVSKNKGSTTEVCVSETDMPTKGHSEQKVQGADNIITGQKTIEEVVNEIAGKPTLWSVMFVIVAMSYGFSVDSINYITVFAGNVSNCALL